MFTIELRINGNLVAHVKGTRVQDFEDEALYAYDYYDLQSGELRRGNLTHTPAEGLRTLVGKVLTNKRESVVSREKPKPKRK